MHFRSISQWKFLFTALLLSLALVGCGGGGGDSTLVNNATIRGIAQLGLMSGATVRLFDISDTDTPIAETTTSAEPSSYGQFTFENLGIVDSRYYLLVVSSGIDTDPDDDGIVSAEDFLNVKGSFRALASGEQLKTNEIRVTALSDLAYIYNRPDKSEIGSDELKQSLATLAADLVEDINQDGSVDDLDLLKFDPLTDSGKVRMGYKNILTNYVPNIHQGAQENNKIESLLNLIPPTIDLTKGKFAEVPFFPELSVANIPKGLQVQWLLDGEEFDPASPPEMVEEGQKDITINLYSHGELVKTYYRFLRGYKATKLAEVEATPEQDSEIYLYADEVPDGLAGARLIVPAGALSTNRTLSMSTNSESLIPGTEGGTISTVLTLKPSGTRFSKPVTVAIPFHAENINPESIRIVRTDENGDIDYLVPLQVDTEKRLIYFETTHFSHYSIATRDILTEGNNFETAIADIEKRLPGAFTSLTEKEWLDVLSLKIGQGEAVDMTVFDVYRSMKTSEDIKSDIGNNGIQGSKVIQGYLEAFVTLYGQNSFPETGTLKEWKIASAIISDPIKEVAKRLIKPDFVEQYYEAKGIYNDIQLISNVTEEGVVGKLLDLYKNNLLSVSTSIIKKLGETKLNLQIKTYFDLRKNYRAEDLISALDNRTQEKFFGGIKAGGPAYGYFDRGDLTPEGKPDPNFWKMVEGLYFEYRRQYGGDERLRDLINRAIEEIEYTKNPDIILDGAITLDTSKQSTTYPAKEFWPEICGNETLDIQATFQARGFEFDSKLLTGDNLYAIASLGGEENTETSGDCNLADTGLLDCTFADMPIVNNDETSVWKPLYMFLSYNNGMATFNNSFDIRILPYQEYDVELDISRGYLDGSSYLQRIDLKYSIGGITKDVKIPHEIHVSKNDGPVTFKDRAISVSTESLFNSGWENTRIEIKHDSSGKCFNAPDKTFSLDLQEKIGKDLIDSEGSLWVVNSYSDGALSQTYTPEKEIRAGENVTLALYLEEAAAQLNVPKEEFLAGLSYDLDGDNVFQRTQGESNVDESGTELHLTQNFSEPGTFKPTIRFNLNQGPSYKVFGGVSITVLPSDTPIDTRTNNQPIAEAGKSITVMSGELFTLDGGQSFDPDGDSLSHEWRLAGEYVGSTKTFVSSHTNEGVYKYSLKVTDPMGLAGMDWVGVTVRSNGTDTSPDPEPTPEPEPAGILTLSTKTLNFGEVGLGDSLGKPISLTNTGNAPLQNVFIRPLSGDMNAFSTHGVPNTILTGATWAGSLNYTPTEGRSQSAVFEIGADGVPTQQITASGVGIVYGLGARSSLSSINPLAGQEIYLTVDIYSGNPDYSLSVDWGDGSAGVQQSIAETASLSHTYDTVGNYPVETRVTDAAGEIAVRTHQVTVTDAPSMLTQWTAEARDIIDNEEITGLPIDATEKLDGSGITYYEYSSDWLPSTPENDFFVKYRLPVPPGLIDLTNKVRMTAIVRSSNFPSYDRELAFGTDSTEFITAYVDSQPGYFRQKDYATGQIVRSEIDAFNDSYGVAAISQYALEFDNGTLTASRYESGTYTSLYTHQGTLGNHLAEVQLTFKGNGIIKVVKLEYDKDGNGLYDDGYLVLNTQDQKVDWSLWEDSAKPPQSNADLQACINEALGLGPEATPTEEELSTVDILVCRVKDIRDLSLLQGLTNLASLTLDWNQINDLSPLKELTNLTLLSLEHNQISDLTPLQGLHNLTYLSLQGNQISDLSPLKGLPNLSTLWLDSNQISDPSPLQEMYSLSALSLGGNEISDLYPLQSLTNLETLDVSSNNIVDLLPLEGLTKLSFLSIGFNQIRDLSPLQGMTNLSYLSATRNKISSLSPLQNLSDLTTLWLDMNQINDLAPLQGLQNLSLLSLGDNQISDLSSLQGLVNLSALHLWLNQISNISPLNGLTGLQTLDLSNNCILDFSNVNFVPNLITDNNSSDNCNPSEIEDPVAGSFVLVPAGCFQMGDVFGDGGADETPVHEVCLDAFYIGKFEVTQGVWEAVKGSNPSRFSDCGPDCPVETVSWYDIRRFLPLLNEQTGKNFRLPTEAEWEYAARGEGLDEKWAGTSIEAQLGDYAWTTDNSGWKTHPVGQKSPNSLGLYDMSGNVMEWVFDAYDSTYYSSSPLNNPMGPLSNSTRGQRGGSWYKTLADARITNRHALQPELRGGEFGFRLVLPIPTEP